MIGEGVTAGLFDGFSREKKKKERYILSLWDYFDGVIEKKAVGWLTGRRTREEEKGFSLTGSVLSSFFKKTVGLFDGWERTGKKKGIVERIVLK